MDANALASAAALQASLAEEAESRLLALAPLAATPEERRQLAFAIAYVSALRVHASLLMIEAQMRGLPVRRSLWWRLRWLVTGRSP